MKGFRVTLRILAALVMVSATLDQAPPAGQPAAHRQPAGQPAAHRQPPEQPCPAPSPPVPRPTRSSPPPLDPAHRSVGGPRLATAGLVVPPGASAPPRLTATSWLVADLTSGAVLGGCGPHEYGVPASVQKLLLAAAVMPMLDPGRKIRVIESDLDFEPGSSAVGLVRDGQYSVGTLWLGLLLNSGNDAANVLARLGGGPAGMAGGLAAMNTEARRLRAFQTHAATPSGLDGPGQFTSAYDLALIARACFAREDFRRYVSTPVADVPAQAPTNSRGFQIINDNQLLHRYPGALGGKTGYTDLARHSFVGAAERDGRRLLVTLLGAESQPMAGWQQGAALLDWGFALPTDASVGQLVTGEQAAAPAAGTEPARAAEPTNGAGSPGTGWPVLLAGAGGLAIALALLLLVVLLRRRANPGIRPTVRGRER